MIARSRNLVLPVLGGALLAVTAAVPAPATTPTRTHGPRIRDASGNSINWSGYAVNAAAGSVTDVKGSWIVPAVVGAVSKRSIQYSSFWVGIDGSNSNTVEQCGTDSDWVNGQAVYYAWYEFYPAPSVTISNFPVKPGDAITANVVNNGGGSFTLTITNASEMNPATGAPYTFTTTGSVNSAHASSAEWIAEAPSGGSILPLADFGTVYFGQDYTTPAGVGDCSATVGGATGPIASFGTTEVEAITMVAKKGGRLKAQPSGLSSDGTSFSVRWFSTGP
jgi:hypothetical protein